MKELPNTRKILILHPEGNINNNPNLSGIVEILCENNFKVDIYSPIRPEFYQSSPAPGAELFLENPKDPAEYTLKIINKYCNPYDLVIGVDEGIIEASKISNIQGVPLGYISYEIFFEDEIGSELKQSERNTCKNVIIAVVQDEIRASHLSEQNLISRDKMIYIPVSGRKSRAYTKQDYLYKKFNIPQNKKIALAIGSIGKWTMIEDILSNIDNWNEEWVFVLHPRYGDIGFSNQLRELIARNRRRVYVSKDPVPKVEDLYKIICSADVGIALYKPDYKSKYSGKNIKYMGLSSGKTSLYLQYGLPVLVSRYEPLATLITNYKAGAVVDEVTDIADYLNEYHQNISDNCISLFNDHMDLDKTVMPLLAKVNVVCVQNRTHNISSIENIKGASDAIYQQIIKPNENNVESILNSTTYKVGNIILTPLKRLLDYYRSKTSG